MASNTTKHSANAAWRAGIASAVVAVAALTASNASAYCRTTTCDPTKPGSNCEVDANKCPTVGIPLYWPNGCVAYSVNKDGSPLRDVSYEAAQKLTDQAMSRWLNADCGDGRAPSLEALATSKTSCEGAGFSQNGGNVNLILFRDDDWPYSNDGAVLAFTTLNYDIRNGRILDADIEVNSEFSELTTADDEIIDDLDSILTHESGHFFGLSHVLDEEATMYASYQPGESLKRTLNADDAAGICAIYPPGQNTTYCDPEPYKGYANHCYAAADPSCAVSGPVDGFNPNCLPVADEGCSVSVPAPGSQTPLPWLLAGALGLGAMLRRRRNA